LTKEIARKKSFESVPTDRRNEKVETKIPSKDRQKSLSRNLLKPQTDEHNVSHRQAEIFL
jgi:hypothetical protein